MKIITSLLVTAAATLTLHGQPSIGVNQTFLYTVLAAHEKHVLNFTVSNSGDQSAPVSVSTEDAEDIDGDLVVTNHDHDRALARRVSLYPTNFTLEPGAARDVQVVVDGSDGHYIPGSYWALLFVQTSRLSAQSEPTPGRAMNVRIVQRIAIPLGADYQPPAKPSSDLTITGMALAGHTVAIAVKNPEKYARLVVSGSLQVTPVAGGKMQVVPIGQAWVLPESTKQISVTLPASMSGIGKADVLSVLDYGGEDLLVGEQIFGL